MNRSGKISIALVIVLVILGVGACGIGLLGMVFITTMNTDARLVNQFKAKQTENQVVYDKFWKTLQQKAGIAQLGADQQTDFFNKIMSARYEDKDNVLVNMITEQNPTFDMSLMKDLSLSVEALRAEFATHQTRLIDLKREHDNLRTLFPSSIVLAILGVKELEMDLVTSTRTKGAFETGKDDDVQLFEKKTEAPAPAKEPKAKMTPEQAKEALGKVPVLMTPGNVPAVKK